ncbi:MAG: hypothetical protein ACJ73E_12995 [Mycobacteriales bacterium]
MIDVDEQRYSNLPPAIFRHWVHSREEDAGGLEVFRRDDFELPPSFGRDGFEMREDGTFVQEDVGPADGIERTEGRWSLSGPGSVTVSFDVGAQVRDGFSFEVVRVDEEILQRRPVRAPSAYVSVPAADEAQLQAYQALPPPASSRLLDFDQAQILALRTFPPRYILRVAGTAPYADIDVALVPLVYVRQPEYWEIEVVGSLRGVAVGGPTPYQVSLRLDGSLGTRGIEVVGATRRERFDIPGRSAQGECRDWSAVVDRRPPGPPTLIVTGECDFPTAGSTVELHRAAPQGINPRDLLLDKVVTPPSGPAASVLTAVPVRYTENDPPELDTVTIRPDGPSIPVTEAR